MMNWTGEVSDAHKIFLGKLGRRRLLGRRKEKCMEILELRVWSGFEWLRTGFSGRLLCTRG
jgi:hypothetical protein